MMNHFRKIIIFGAGAVIAMAFFWSSPARAAVISISSSSIKLDTQGESINAIELHLSFTTSTMMLQGVNDGGSIINFWITPLAVSNHNGTVDIVGVIPGGINIKSGTVVAFHAVPAGAGGSGGTASVGTFSVISARVLLNDGNGTAAKLSFNDPTLALVAESATSSTSTAISDIQPPNPFTPQIGNDPMVFGGKYFLAFSTTDEQSGIDHYEIMEGSGTWQNATSPYLLTDQTLSSDIYVRAIDKAGNLRMVKVPATHPNIFTSIPKGSTQWPLIVGVGAIILLLILIVLMIFFWKRNKPVDVE